ncbi:hypothetical protein GUJ93_ZPchr0002g23820 [Zizania palustris]|uniref:Uncharacterized protein n=1 Tax=Zizania palustris TaxID=103762 RepID=A0A8J5V9N6_ZIZPA|nr:hypothetical protein GUJ93_ZPchr0002g23820 [Zizania palustris]
MGKTRPGQRCGGSADQRNSGVGPNRDYDGDAFDQNSDKKNRRGKPAVEGGLVAGKRLAGWRDGGGGSDDFNRADDEC